MDPYSVIIKPRLSEKTMNQIYDENKITFVVRKSANKRVIKTAFEELYEAKVTKVNTHITPRGEKVATIELDSSETAEDIALSLGIF
ncbi:MAG: 50S ribosomal protein L23 [Methanosphaera sp.]|uniref:50S ribosomal protein L23 n=1 Tax=Methanosphaera sp. TaxID=2666342 RepID=UPI0025E31712|nr:50S ribosomal protein L23 [Methanosphaera sp.]MCI5866634.1 50S ribosomal protein L23 [Methanosphaera sp.]MDD6535118.1 50S ribosomal protein L23 [Methanosphaera sp.]MDY3955928.1 50S ribosomal protein L23 [Methanosphaera sp.]